MLFLAQNASLLLAQLAGTAFADRMVAMLALQGSIAKAAWRAAWMIWTSLFVSNNPQRGSSRGALSVNVMNRTAACLDTSQQVAKTGRKRLIGHSSV